MSDLHFNSLDLNLLRIFDTLLDERSVTRAEGARLGMTQSAVSHALNRLRHALDDELFVRTSDGMRPTARAVEIGPSVRAALGNLQAALTPQVFEASIAHRRFSLVAGPYTSAVLLPQVAARLRDEAPFVQLRLTGPDGRLIENLDAGEVDAALTPAKSFPKRTSLTKEAVRRDGGFGSCAPTIRPPRVRCRWKRCARSRAHHGGDAACLSPRPARTGLVLEAVTMPSSPTTPTSKPCSHNRAFRAWSP